MTTPNHTSFTFLRETNIESLNVTVQEFEHKNTGAQHIHFVSDSTENVFLVAFRTMPESSNGVAHILEHTALCGSKKYPVRDPFFMMSRRSINTFMNAFTSSDWTAYPFSSLSNKDYFNLLDVYLDAAFFSRLDPLDFAQEGHRLEFKIADDKNSPLEYKGVVFNEMKGAMSSVTSQLWHTLCKYLYPTTTYHINSGGDPASIPDLSYQQLLDFYRTHYHPSNAIFMTFGDIPAATLQEKFETQALSQFKKLDHSLSVPNEKRYFAPIRVQESYPYAVADDEQASTRKSHVVLSWLLGDVTDLESSMRAQLLSGLLLNNSASPLLHCLETTNLGDSPSPLCGMDDSQKELTFICGLESCDENDADAIEALILDCLQMLASNGMDQAEIESALHQLELHQREIGGDHYPYGLQLILNALPACTHRGNPAAQLDIDSSLAKLRVDITRPDFVKELVSECLLDNQHRVRLTLSPDKKLQERKDAAEQAQLEKIKQALSEAQKDEIVQHAATLKQRQEAEDDENLLPKVTLHDVPKKEVDFAPNNVTSNTIKTTAYAAGTNGLVYQQVIHCLPQLNTDELSLLPHYSNCITEVGAGKLSYLEMQKRQSQVCGSFNAYSNIRPTIDNVQNNHSFFIYSAKALNRNQGALNTLMRDTLQKARFDEHARFKEIIAQIRTSRERSITGNGHGLAMLAASASISPISLLTHTTNGLEAIRQIKTLDNNINDAGELQKFAEKLEYIHQKIQRTEKQLLVVAEEDELNGFVHQFSDVFKPISSQPSVERLSLGGNSGLIRQAWLTNSQVNFCAKAYATVPAEHKDAAALTVLGGLLRNGFLHTAIREQGGAYGGGASHDIGSGAFRFYSYRDPRLQETLRDFDRAVDWLVDTQHPWQKIEEAILGVISSLDKSESPAGRAKRVFHANLHGRTHTYRQNFRERVLAVTEDDLKRVANTYLQPEKANIAVVGDFAIEEETKKMGLTTEKL